MAKTSRLSPAFYFRRYVCHMAARLPVNSLLALTFISASLFGFTWGCFPVIKTIFTGPTTIELLESILPNPTQVLTILFYACVFILHVIGSIPVSRLLQIYYPGYFNIERDE